MKEEKNTSEKDDINTKADDTDNEKEVLKTEEDEISTPKAEIETLRQQVEEFKSKWLYTYSEFENYRRRVKLEIQNEVANAIAKVVLNFVAALDSIDSALTYIQDENVRKGVELIKSVIEDALLKSGVKKVEVKTGEIFSPTTCEVVGYEENADLQDGTILKVLRSGLEFQGRIIRPAQVIVNKSPKNGDEKPKMGEHEKSVEDELRNMERIKSEETNKVEGRKTKSNRS